eukprot:403357537
MSRIISIAKMARVQINVDDQFQGFNANCYNKLNEKVIQPDINYDEDNTYTNDGSFDAEQLYCNESLSFQLDESDGKLNNKILTPSLQQTMSQVQTNNPNLMSAELPKLQDISLPQICNFENLPSISQIYRSEQFMPQNKNVSLLQYNNSITQNDQPLNINQNLHFKHSPFNTFGQQNLNNNQQIFNKNSNAMFCKMENFSPYNQKPAFPQFQYSQINLQQTLINDEENEEEIEMDQMDDKFCMDMELEDFMPEQAQQFMEQAFKDTNFSADKNGIIRIDIDVSSLRGLKFKDVKEIRVKIEYLFAPQNIKMISKRAERHYPNGYCVYVLYCNRCQKRNPTYQRNRQYTKRSTNCPFHMKFTKINDEMYQLHDGEFYHNHELSIPVLDPEILNELDQFDPISDKPAHIKRMINDKFKKSISYAQIAYEMNKRKQKALGKTKNEEEVHQD